MRRNANWLSLAATPSFAAMALLTGVLDRTTPDVLCATMGASPFGGMMPMYLLMSLFHAAPWLKILPSRNEAARTH